MNPFLPNKNNPTVLEKARLDRAKREKEREAAAAQENVQKYAF
jgi:hypothetical protein